MSRGAGLHITMAAGLITVAGGDGGQDRCIRTIGRSGRPRTFRSGDGAAASDLALDSEDGVVLDGCRLDRVTGSIRGGVDTAGDLVS